MVWIQSECVLQEFLGQKLGLRCDIVEDSEILLCVCVMFICCVYVHNVCTCTCMCICVEVRS